MVAMISGQGGGFPQKSKGGGKGKERGKGKGSSGGGKGKQMPKPPMSPIRCGQAGHWARNCPTGGEKRKRQEDADDVNMVNNMDIDEDCKTEIYALDKEDLDAAGVAVRNGGAASSRYQIKKYVNLEEVERASGMATARWMRPRCAWWSHVDAWSWPRRAGR